MKSRTLSRQSRLAYFDLVLCGAQALQSHLRKHWECPEILCCMVQELSDKIAQLNAAIDEVSSQMKAKDPKPEVVEEVLA